MRVVDTYTFTPGAPGAGTIVIPEVLELEDFARINNVTRGVPLYGVDLVRSGMTVSVAGGSTTLTLEQTTTFCDALDELQILVYEGTGGSTSGTLSEAGGAYDAFGRARVSEPLTIADYKVPYGIGGEFYVVQSGGGVSRPVSNGVLNPSAARLTYIAQNYDSTDSMAFLCYASSLGNGADSAVTMQWRELQ